MHLCQKVNTEIAMKKYYSALKTIQSIPLIKISNYQFYEAVSSDLFLPARCLDSCSARKDQGSGHDGIEAMACKVLP